MRRVVALLAVAVLAACATFATTGPAADYKRADALESQKNYHEAATVYYGVAQETPSTSLAADSLFESAYLNSFYDNPQRDYALAFRQFDEFLRRFPDDSRVPEAKNWLAVLKAVVESKRENEQLKKSIEQLKRIDIRHEERRRR